MNCTFALTASRPFRRRGRGDRVQTALEDALEPCEESIRGGLNRDLRIAKQTLPTSRPSRGIFRADATPQSHFFSSSFLDFMSHFTSGTSKQGCMLRRGPGMINVKPYKSDVTLIRRLK